MRVCVSLCVSVFFIFVFVATQSLNSCENNIYILSVELTQVPTYCGILSSFFVNVETDLRG